MPALPKRKLPLTNEIISAMLAVHDGARRGDLEVDRSSYNWVAMLAVFAVLAESGERKDEVTGDRGKRDEETQCNAHRSLRFLSEHICRRVSCFAILIMFRQP